MANGLRGSIVKQHRAAALKHDPEKRVAVFPAQAKLAKIMLNQRPKAR